MKPTRLSIAQAYPSAQRRLRLNGFFGEAALSAAAETVR
jgi:hypothetical protein